MDNGLVRCNQQLGLEKTGGYNKRSTTKRERGISEGVEEEIMKPDERLSRKVLESHYQWCLENGRDVSWYGKLKGKKK